MWNALLVLDVFLNADLHDNKLHLQLQSLKPIFGMCNNERVLSKCVANPWALSKKSKQLEKGMASKGLKHHAGRGTGERVQRLKSKVSDSWVIKGTVKAGKTSLKGIKAEMTRETLTSGDDRGSKPTDHLTLTFFWSFISNTSFFTHFGCQVFWMENQRIWEEVGGFWTFMHSLQVCWQP